MPIKGISEVRRLTWAGKFRLGETVARRGKSYPRALDYRVNRDRTITFRYESRRVRSAALAGMAYLPESESPVERLRSYANSLPDAWAKKTAERAILEALRVRAARAEGAT